MTVSARRTGTSTPPIPRPRDVDPDRPPEPGAATHSPALPPVRRPWPEPWRPGLGARLRTEYWDVTTASWRSREPFPRPRP